MDHPFLSIEDLLREPPARADLIPGILPSGSLVALTGYEDSCKTFLMLDWALSVASGTAWANRVVHSVPTLYLHDHNQRCLPSRMRAWHAAHPQADTDRLRLAEVSPTLLWDPVELAALRKRLARRIDGPVLVILDLAAYWPRASLPRDRADYLRLQSELHELHGTFPDMTLIMTHSDLSGTPSRVASTIMWHAATHRLRTTRSRDRSHIRLACAYDHCWGDCRLPTYFTLAPAADGVYLQPIPPPVGKAH